MQLQHLDSQCRTHVYNTPFEPFPVSCLIFQCLKSSNEVRRDLNSDAHLDVYSIVSPCCQVGCK